tara:strand:- start:1872 stop:2456 length:585 start_codon:yes stop_codon:yes gene_type:complete
MAQHDYNIANADGATVRADINNALSAIQSNNSGSGDPSSLVAGMLYYDTGDGYFKVVASNGSTLTNLFTIGSTTNTNIMSDSANEYTKTQNFNATTLTDASTVAWDASINQVTSVTLGGNRAFGAPTNQVDGAVYILRVIQDGTGSRIPTWNAVFKWSSATAPTLTTTASAIDAFVFISNGTNMYEIGRSLNIG